MNRLVNIGILVYHFKCEIFKMDLKAPAIYRMIRIRSCLIPRDLNDFDVIRNTLASLSQLRSLVPNEVKKARESNSKISKKLTWIREPVSDYKGPDFK
ncbi:hypothetical protein CLU79DRAFT_74488 [Phycomyces nitens]|nr:hypothetical protein CLU79DRAFT_74488 [Phycomyces nitens]